VSTVTSGGLDPLRQLLATARQEQRPVVQIRLERDAGRLLAELYREAEVISVGSAGAAVIVQARIDDAVAGRLRREGAAIEPLGVPTPDDPTGGAA